MAIRDTAMQALRKFKDVEPAELWHAIYAAHVRRKSGVASPKRIQAVISANQSWIKSSGHAFEEIVEHLVNGAICRKGICMLLQRGVSELLRNGEIANAKRDIEMLEAWTASGAFDHFLLYESKKGLVVYACAQTKTSIRDRVTRDREPSMQAMAAFFWSVGIVLDPAFLALPKFKAMVNGGSQDFKQNGWHGMYAFSEQHSDDRIYPIGPGLATFADHAVKAAEHWQKNRQWFDHTWRPEGRQ